MDVDGVIRHLSESGVEFIIIGGTAANLHGSARATFDVDIVYRRTPENIARLARACSSLHPYLRGAPPGLPFRFDERTIQAGLNFTLTTDLGPVDFLGEMTGGGSYDALVAESVTMPLSGFDVRCLSLDQLIRAKRAAGRLKDLDAIAELESLREQGAG